MLMDEIEAWRSLPHLGALFTEFWVLAEAWDPTIRHSSVRLESRQSAELQAACQLAEASAAMAKFLDHFEGPWRAAPNGASAERAGLVMDAMRSIDLAFLDIHPRTLLVPAGFPSAPPPAWLEERAEDRLFDGVYFASGSRSLIPKGPLGRTPRSPNAAYADTLADQFCALAVAPTATNENGRPIKVVLAAIGPDPAQGVPSVGLAGAERVVFFPIAEEPTDFELSDREDGGRFYLDVRPAAALDPANRLLAGLREIGAADIALSPELTMPEAAADRLCATLSMDPRPVPRLILAGTGETEATVQGRAWNEARLINSRGAPLLRQRKMWPFGMARDRAAGLGLVDPGVNGLLMENVASGDTLSIVDLPDFGRCLVLICQDFKITPLVAEILRTYQPDWVLVPVLDVDIADHGWCRQRAFGLSELSQARFMIVNSQSLGRRLTPPKISPLGIALGPLVPFDASDESRATTIVTASGAGPVRGEITWRSTGWSTTSIGSKKPVSNP